MTELEEIAARMKEINGLLSEFGLTLCGFGSGVTAYYKDKPMRGNGWAGEPICFGANEWKWLEPLLVELREYRRLYEAQVIQPAVDKPGDGVPEAFLNAKVACDLQAQGHIPTVEKMLAEWKSWEEIGKEIGWCPETVKKHYKLYRRSLLNEA